MMTPPTFRTFRRELSSVWQTVTYPRTACNVLEQLSGVTERRMIVPMTVRPQQRGRSQTWRTFLRNHVGAFSCHAVVASSERPGDADVVDTGLFSLGLTQPSGTGTLPTARRLPKALPRFNARLLAPRMPWPDLHHRAGTGQFRPRSPTVMCRFDWPTRVRTETPSSGCALRLGSTDSLRRFVRETCQIAIGQFGDAACAAGSINVPTKLTRLGCARSARPRAFLSVAGVLARHSC